MYISKENELFYLSSWNYNAARIMTALATIVKKNGGNVKPLKTALIVNRSIMEYIRKIDGDIERIKAAKLLPERKENALELLTAERERFAAIENEPITVSHINYITFAINGTYYYYQIDENPFFPFLYIKTPIVGGTYSKDSCLTDDKKSWFVDELLKAGCKQETIDAAANAIFDMLCNAKNTIIRRDSKRQRVPNTYNNGYHYETIYVPERRAKIDF